MFPTNDKAAEIARKEDSDLRICRVDLFNVRTEEQFYTALAQSVIKSTASKEELRRSPDEILDLAQKIASDKKLRTKRNFAPTFSSMKMLHTVFMAASGR